MAKMQSKNKIKSWLFAVFFVLLSAGLLWIFSFNSGMYAFNLSPDDNNFFLVGKLLMKGILPYKDVFEQKGPFIYLLYGLASLINGRSLIGVFPFEIIALTLIFVGIYKIGRFFAGQNVAFAISLLTPVFIFMQPFYDYGGTVEFFVLPILTWTIYEAVKASRDGFRLSIFEWGLLGFFVGILFFSKYTLLGSLIVFYLFVFVVYLLKRRFGQMGKMILASGLGFAIAIVPWLVYFQLHGALRAFYHVYFFINMHLYSSSMGIFVKIGSAFAYFFRFFAQNPFLLIVGIIGILSIVCAPKKFFSWTGKALLLLMMLANDLMCVYGHVQNPAYPYYFLVFIPFVILGLIVLAAEALGMLAKFTNRTYKPGILTCIICFLIGSGLCFAFNQNYQYSRLFPANKMYTLNQKGEPAEPVQLQFSRIINRESRGKPRILVYGRLDSGFYAATGALPINYYFQQNNIPYDVFPAMMDSQNQAIKKQKPQWIIIRVMNHKRSLKHWLRVPPHNKIKKTLKHNYRIRAEHPAYFEKKNVNYYLYERR